MTDTATIEALLERLEKFRSEWLKLTHTCDEIHGLHMGTEKEAVIRASDLDQAASTIRALSAENERLAVDRDNAISTLDSWFVRRKLSRKMIDSVVCENVAGYLRTSRSGGMPNEQSDMVQSVIDDMVRLGFFADLFSRARLETLKEADTTRAIEKES